MMPATATKNRQMFWRIVRRLLIGNPGRLFVILLALGAGAAVTAALLNLQVDAKRRLTTEFRAFGPNISILPRSSDSQNEVTGTLDESLLNRVPESNEANPVIRNGLLALIADAYALSSNPADPSKATPVVVVGHTGSIRIAIRNAGATQQTALEQTDAQDYCNLGLKVAAVLHINSGDQLVLRSGPAKEVCRVASVASYGGQEDEQVSVPIKIAQRLVGSPGRLSSIQVVATGTPASVMRFAASLAQAIPEASVRPIRQFTEGEAKIYNRISGLLTATVAIVLLLTGLCVMAAMTNVAMERKNDVGLMKAIGGATRRVLRLFLAEAALLGLAGGLIGAAAGIFLSVWLGKEVFGVAAQPRLIVYPLAVTLTILVAILSAFPLRRLAGVRPASVFRGEA
jgi:putative ABC transport system permease protein